MTLTWTYRDAFGISDVFTESLDDRVRLGSWTVTELAEHLSSGSSTVVFDDPDADIGHDNDAILGNARLNVIEDDMPSGNQRVYTGIFGTRTYSRGIFRTGAGRQVSAELHDLNALMSLRVIPNSDKTAVRKAESVTARMNWLMSTTYRTGVVDNGFVVGNATMMTEADYRGQRPANVVNDCELAAGFGWNAFVYWDEPNIEPALWFDNANTSTTFTSTLRISNVLGDVDNLEDFFEPTAITFAPSIDASLSRDPSNLGSGVYLPYKNAAVFRERASTIARYGRKDLSAPNSNVSTKTRAIAQADDFLLQHETEEDRITVTVELPPTHVNLIRAGHRIAVKFSHLPGYEDFRWCRVVSRSPGQTKPTDDRYWLRLELSPCEAGCEEGPTVRQHAENSAPSNGYADLPAPALAGNLILVRIEWRPGPAFHDVDMEMEAGQGYTSLAQGFATGETYGATAIFAKDAAGGEQHILRDLGIEAAVHMCVYEISNASVADLEVVSATHQTGASPHSLSDHASASGLAFSTFVFVHNEPGIDRTWLGGTTSADWLEHFDGPDGTNPFDDDAPWIYEGNATPSGGDLTPTVAISPPSGKTLAQWAGVSVLVAGGDCGESSGPAAPDPEPPVGTIPPPSGGDGDKLNKDFADGVLAPFVIQTYPNDHPGDDMIEYGRFAPSQVSVHDGYLDLRATKQADGSWLQGFVATFHDDGTDSRTFDFQYGTVRVVARMNTGQGAWQGFWLLDKFASGAEIDWPELISGNYTANVHGSSNDGQDASETPFAADEWHEYSIVWTSTDITFQIDGSTVGTTTGANLTNRMALLADAKVGPPGTAPDGTTPNELYLHIATITVDT